MTGLLFFTFIFLKNAWVADDAYIAFRSVEQLFAGNGPRWNFDERVQVYTSPLWFGLLSLSRILISDLFIGSILVSALCCLGWLWISRKLINNDMRWWLFVLLICGMWAVMDFTSSGLENPLLYLLLAAYLYFYFRLLTAKDLTKELKEKQTLLNGWLICLGLLAITRHDVAALVAIPTLYVVWHLFRDGSWRLLLQKSYLAWLPLCIWTLFSVVYYGVPFPNTAYAKMMHGIPRRELMDFGQLYLYVSLKWDYFSQITLFLLVLRVLWKREKALIAILAGIFLNVFYIIYVGGDFMQGRFLSAPLSFAALALCAPLITSSQVMTSTDRTTTDIKTQHVLYLGTALLLLMIVTNSPLRLPPDSGFDIGEGKRHFSWNGILNERNFYFKSNSLWAYGHRDPSQPFPHHKWCLMGKRATEAGKQVSDFGGIGMYGYCAGLNLIVIDNLALGEPFLARLPKPEKREWRAGHFHRDYPRGYLESRNHGANSGVNYLQDPELAALWQDVTLLTRAPLFAPERWRAIWRINRGTYQDIGPAYFADIAQKTAR